MSRAQEEAARKREQLAQAAEARMARLQLLSQQQQLWCLPCMQRQHPARSCRVALHLITQDAPLHGAQVRGRDARRHLERGFMSRLARWSLLAAALAVILRGTRSGM